MLQAITILNISSKDTKYKWILVYLDALLLVTFLGIYSLFRYVVHY